MTQKKKTNNNDKNKTQTAGSKTEKTTTTLDTYQKTFAPARDKMLKRLTTLAETVSDPEAKQALTGLIKSINPQKKGREEMSGQWVIPSIRVVYGTTKEKPDGAEPGDLITTSGFILQQPFRVTLLYIYEQNRMFASGGNKALVCAAPDAKLGIPFGICATCANLPMTKNATRTLTDCDNGICFIVLSQDMRLYRIEFFKTSYKAGQTLDQLAAATENIWDRWFNVKTQLQSNGSNEWHIFRVSPANADTSEYVREAADALYDLVYAERKAFLEQHYVRAAADAQAASNVNENVDAARLGLDTDDGEDNPDLSGGGI